MVSSSKPTALGCHIYSGAFTHGIAKNFNVLGQLEEGPWGYKTAALNFPEMDHPLGKNEWQISKYVGKVTVMYANPPCAPWSTAGSKLGINDPRLIFTANAVALAKEIKPDFFILESVCRAWSAGSEYYEGLFGEFKKMGYGVTVFMTNALLHGAPQNRERVHFIAHRYELNLKPPEDFNELDLITVEEAIGDLVETARWTSDEEVIPNHVTPEPNTLEAQVMAELVPGEGYNKAVERLQARGVEGLKRWRLVAGRLNHRTVSRTILDVGALIHPYVNRRLTLREGARLCTYPDDFIFAHESNGGKEFQGAKASDVTQAVIPRMGEYLGQMFMTSLENDVVKNPLGATEIIDWRPMARQYTPGRHFKRILEQEGL